MGIEARLRDALALWQQQRAEGALLQVLVAVAATARLRFPQGTPSRRDVPKTMGDGEAFEAYVTEELPNIAVIKSFSFVFKGESHSLGWVLYKWFRCSLLHEAELAPDVAFVPDSRRGHIMIKHEAGPPPRVVISETLVVLLADLVCRSRENAALATDVRETFIAYVSGS